MNHKHIMVIIEAMNYSGEIDTQDAINDLVDYTECVESNKTEDHYKRCVLNETEEVMA
jgi:hypothetical protein